MPVINTKRGAASTSAVQLVALDASRTDLYITNEDLSIIIRVGDATLTGTGTPATCGLAIMPGQTLAIVSAQQGGANPAAQEWWIVSDSGTPAYSVLEYGDFS